MKDQPVPTVVKCRERRQDVAPETPTRGPTKRQCDFPGHPSLAPILRLGGPFARAGSGRRIVV